MASFFHGRALVVGLAAFLFTAACGASGDGRYTCATGPAPADRPFHPESWCDGDSVARCEPTGEFSEKLVKTPCGASRPRCQEFVETLSPAVCQVQELRPDCKATKLSLMVADDLQVVDLDHDGRSDLVGTHDNTTVVALRNADGTFRVLPGAPGAAGVAGDFDGDGIVDLARFGGEWSVDPKPRPIAIRKGHGDGTFDGPVETAVTLALIGLRVMDVNGDHIDDLVSVEYDSPRLQVILGGRAGLRVLPPQTGLPCSGGGTLCLGPAADFDGNGTADFFVGRSLWLGGKDGVFTNGPSYEDYPHIPADINHDGRADLVGVSFDKPEIIYRAARNDGTFESAITLMSVAPYEANAILILPADVTGDGIIDLVVSQPSSRVLMIGVGSAAGGFAPPTFYQPTVEDQVASSYGEGPQYDGTSVMFALEPPGPGGRDILLARADGELLVFPAMCTHAPR